MRRLARMIAFDIRFQFRHGFYGVYVLICGLYLLLLYYVPDEHKDRITLLLTFSDPSAIGLLVAGGIVLLERDQGIHASLFATPLRIREYLFAKIISLSILSLFAAWVIHGFALGIPDHPILYSLGVLLTSSLFTLVSIAVVARAATINGFILLSQLYALPFIVPLLGLWNIGPTLWYAVIPTSGSLLLLASAYSPLTAMGASYAFLVLMVGNLAVYWWAQHEFRQCVLRKGGY